MENMDFSKLRGFDTLKIHKQLEEYLDMLRSSDEESQILAIGFLYNNSEILNYFHVLLDPYQADSLEWHLKGILDDEFDCNVKKIFLFRITHTLEKIRRGFNSFRYSYDRAKK